MSRALRAAVAGATGLVGRELLPLLIADPGIREVHCIGRRAPALVDGKLVVHSHDLGTVPALPPVDVAFCCLGTTIRKAGSQAAFREVDFNMVRRFALAAHAAGAQRFLLVSALGAKADSAVFYNRVKGEIEAEVAAIGFASLHLFRPSLLLGSRAETRPAERVGSVLFGAFAPLMCGPARRYRPVAARAVAEAMRAAAHSGATGTFIVESDAIAEAGA